MTRGIQKRETCPDQWRAVMFAKTHFLYVPLLMFASIGAGLSTVAHAQPASPAWKSTVMSGQPFGVAFDTLTRPVGTIRPNGLYIVTFRPGEGTWTASGPMHPDGYQSDVTYPGGTLCNPNDYVICIWGGAFEFDDKGQVLDTGRRRIGQLRRVGLRERIAAGEPFSVRLDALASNIGTIKAGEQYAVAFLPVERAWKVSGPMYPSGFQTHTDPASSALCDPAEYTLCLWGGAFRFDDQGRVRSDAHGVVGRVAMGR
jgi:hypothetical protein